jgi:hypothetical protein
VLTRQALYHLCHIPSSKSWFVEKINKIDKALAKATKERGQRLKLIKLEMGKGI